MRKSIVIGVLTGHCALQEHLERMKIEQDSIFKEFWGEEKSSFHYLARCPGYKWIRREVFQEEEIEAEDLLSLKWSDIQTVIKRTEKIDHERVGV